MTHCPDCGSELALTPVEGRDRTLCTSCDKVHYVQLKVGAGVTIERDGELLLVRRRHEPFQGAWNLPAGYCEVDEAPEETARREALEETGLQTEIDGIVGVFYFDDDPRGNGILIAYRAKVTGGLLTDTAEAESATYFPAGRLPMPLSGGGHGPAILAWAAVH